MGPTVAPATVLATAPPFESLDTRQLADLDTGDAHMASVVQKVRRVLGKPIPLLILGETGVGKEWLAKAYHQASERRGLL